MTFYRIGKSQRWDIFACRVEFVVYSRNFLHGQEMIVHGRAWITSLKWYQVECMVNEFHSISSYLDKIVHIETFLFCSDKTFSIHGPFIPLDRRILISRISKYFFACFVIKSLSLKLKRFNKSKTKRQRYNVIIETKPPFDCNHIDLLFRYYERLIASLCSTCSHISQQF